jgi:hypothetical protein
MKNVTSASLGITLIVVWRFGLGMFPCFDRNRSASPGNAAMLATIDFADVRSFFINSRMSRKPA